MKVQKQKINKNINFIKTAKILFFAVFAVFVFAGGLNIDNSLFEFQKVYAATNTETISASQTWTAPDGVTSVIAECWGTGGSGGGGTSATAGGTGGGAGAYSKTNSVAVTPGAGYTVTIGLNGTNAAGAAGGAGGDTSFTGDSSQKCLAKGGGGGAVSAGTAGIGGAAASGTGDVKFSGGGGFKSVTTVGGGGGGSGGIGLNGTTATAQAGAAAVSGGGPGGVWWSSDGNRKFSC